MISKVLLTEQQASEVIGFKVSTLRNRRHKGLPPRYRKVGRKVFYDKNDIEGYLDSCIRYITPNKPHIKEKYC